MVLTASYGSQEDFYIEMVQAFEELDLNHNGMLSEFELADTIAPDEPNPLQAVQKILNVADLDRDGQVSFLEFIQFVAGQQP